MDMATVHVPSGKTLRDLTDLKSISLNDYTYLVARYMFSHANGDHRFYGSVGTASKAIWPGQNNDKLRKSAPRLLRRNGFKPDQVNCPVASCWIVPDVFPEWINSTSVDDDGSQTTGGEIKRVKFTLQMQQLLTAIHADPARYPREYAKVLGWDPKNAVSVGRSLSNHGYIERRGHTIAARYYPTDKPVPKYKGSLSVPKSEKVVVKVQKPRFEPKPMQPTPIPEDIEQATGGTVVFDKQGRLLVLKDGKLHKAVMEWTLIPI